MLKTRASRWIAVGTLAVVVAAAGVAVAAEGDREGGRRRHGPRGERIARLFRERAERAGERREHRQRALQRLMDAPDEQVKVALDASRDLARMREERRTKAAAILVQAFREGKDAAPEQRERIREAARAKLRAMREEFRAPASEAGMKVVKALTPEQRKKIEDAVQARGRTFDEAWLARRFARRLSTPWAEAMLKARLGER